MIDDEHAISYKLLEPGAPVVTSEGAPGGTVVRVLENRAEHIFDGLDVETPHGPRFVDAPEVARITNLKVELAIDADALAALPERDPKGAPEYRAAKGRRFGRMWRRR
ncbi:hypothetical protein [Capillimicrobium parvum]|uniref:Uncharacterized protein n=1 Tax=Capillimicrobium parvum TaxID=2884022 RepID=A0A9E7BXY2_9ACTN|nr:hypothetical protein [Capillimicrobium parvum]UGS34125.1 hypothetical protein DSM104329_00496 [Capillimicrobium parvum]